MSVGLGAGISEKTKTTFILLNQTYYMEEGFLSSRGSTCQSKSTLLAANILLEDLLGVCTTL